MTLQRDRMRDALSTPTHRPGCHCPVCPKTTTAERLLRCEEPGVSDYSELDTAALLNASANSATPTPSG